MSEQSRDVTFLFTDIEGSTRMWEEQPERMHLALAGHDALVRATIARHDGTVVKMTGDGVHAAFDDPGDALAASIELQVGLSDLPSNGVLPLSVRCGLHAGPHQRRDNDFFGSVVNRAARIMSAAHGGQILLSERVASLVVNKLPEGAALRDLGSVRLRDLSRAEHVFQVVTPRLRSDFPALRSLESTPNNLPQQLTSFVGREREVAEIKALFGNVRFVTLHGAGGIGKSRLSLQVAADLMDEFPDGVWFVELADVADARLVAQAVASVVNVKEEAGKPVVEALLKYVKDRKLLLILDNCEHLIDPSARLAKQLLQASPSLRMLTSSREQLRVSGETIYSVPSLSMPDPKQVSSVAAVTQSEAIRLFIDRTMAVQPGFEVTDANARSLIEICVRLDGIPLAIELAAARMRSMSAENIAARLKDRFKLLVRGDAGALPRQQTLRSLIDWSYDLLAERERVLLRRLSVFAGGWTLGAAEAVCADGRYDRDHVVDDMTQLVEKSLVVMEVGGSRYRMLDTVHHYAQEKLTDSDEAEDLRSRHLAEFLDLAERARPELVGPDQGTWLTRVDLEHENVLASHAWANASSAHAEEGLRLVTAMRRYWLMRGLFMLGHRATLVALAHQKANPRGICRCQALFDAGQFDFVLGRYASAQIQLEESLSIARELHDRKMIAAALQPLGMAYHGQGQLDLARARFNEALALARELGNTREVASALNALAQLHRDEHDLDAAQALYGQVVSLARQIGDRESVGIGLLNLAMVYIGRDLPEYARDVLIEACAIVDDLGSLRLGISLLEVCAGFCVSRQDWSTAARFYGAAEAHAAEMGLRRDPTDEAFLAPLIDRASSALGAAFTSAVAGGRQLAILDAISEARQRFARKSIAAKSI